MWMVRFPFADNGRGIPVDVHPQYGIPGVELVLTTLHSGGKYGQGGYQFSGGTHGVGRSALTQFSDGSKSEVRSDGTLYHLEFERGKTVKKLEVIGKAKGYGHAYHVQSRPEIFKETIEFSRRIAQRLRELAFLNPGLESIFLDRTRRRAKQESFITRTVWMSS